MRPFLKWAGGKYKLIDRIKEQIPLGGGRLIEPFVGSGAVFLNTDFEENILADANQDLINIFNELKNSSEKFISDCKKLFDGSKNNEESFYALRSEFNSTDDSYLKATIFIYLNRHCFNGLCRYNSKGHFNVPFGRYTKPYFPENELVEFSIKCQKAQFFCADFRDVMKMAERGDVVYCDPPYAPLTETSNFSNYTAGGFNLKDQEDLAQLAKELRTQGVYVLISNHDTAFTQSIYKDAKKLSFGVQRYIASKSADRIIASELLAIYHAK